ncbi:MAG TPA: MFS transporter [Candidatus Saccharimonadales bacterium]|nr:MFS transporter [Candidatus Saccharimonadales bacterium]
MKEVTYRLVLAIAILASIIAFLDGSIVNVALPAIQHTLGGGLSTQQWVVDAYLITLGAFMLVAGSLSDIIGRKRVMMIGLIGFGVTSLLCAAATTKELLIIGRLLQGTTGALLVPSSLALIMSRVPKDRQHAAIGAWTSWTGIAMLIGPFVGGVLIDLGSWRYIFLLNVLPIAVTVYLLARLKDEHDTTTRVRLDWYGAVLGALSLGGIVYALIEQPHFGWAYPLIYGTMAVGVVSFILFIWREKVAAQPMMPLGLFRSRNFSAGNIATLSIYAGLSLVAFLITIFVQQVGHYTATAAGLTMVPMSILMFFLASRFGKLSGEYGPRIFMTVGPLIVAAGFVTMLFIDATANYWAMLPGILLVGIGLSVTVAPLTAAILGAVDSKRSGIASAINNVVARVAGLVAVALIGTVTGYNLNLAGFRNGLVLAIVLFVVGGFVSLVGIRNPARLKSDPSQAPVVE